VVKKGKPTVESRETENEARERKIDVVGEKRCRGRKRERRRKRGRRAV